METMENQNNEENIMSRQNEMKYGHDLNGTKLKTNALYCLNSIHKIYITDNQHKGEHMFPSTARFAKRKERKKKKK